MITLQFGDVEEGDAEQYSVLLAGNDKPMDHLITQKDGTWRCVSSVSVSGMDYGWRRRGQKMMAYVMG
jgi:hypothetical protein